MADLINIRPTRDSATSEEMDEDVKKLGMSRNEMILKVVDIIQGFEVIFYHKVEQYIQRCKVLVSKTQWSSFGHRMRQRSRSGTVICPNCQQRLLDVEYVVEKSSCQFSN